MIDLTPVLQAVVSLSATVITVIFIPYIKSKVSAQKQEQLQLWAKIGVAAAEQVYAAGSGEQKKRYVLNFLESQGFKVDANTLSTLIESEVKHLWIDGGKTALPPA